MMAAEVLLMLLANFKLGEKRDLLEISGALLSALTLMAYTS